MMRRLFVSICAVLMFATSFSAIPQTASAVSVSSNITEVCKTNPNSSICSDLKKTDAAAESAFSDRLKNIINVLLFIAGILSVIMVIVSGIRMITANGSSDSVAKARRTLIYSIAGLVVAMIAFAIVNFVLDAL